MSYTAANLSLLTQNVGGGKRRYILTGTDAITSVLGASYVTDGVAKGLRANDEVTYVKTDTNDEYDLIVLSVSATAATLGGKAALVGQATSSAIGFYGATPIVRPSGAAQAAVATTAAVSSGAFGYSSTQANGIITLLNEIRNVLVNLGLMKGS